MRSFGTEMRYVARRLVRAPLFTAVAVATLAVGIGANSAIFSVVNGVLLRPLPFPEPERLVGVWHKAPGLGFDEINQGPAFHFTYRDENRVFEDIGMWSNTSVSVTGLAEPERVEALRMTDGILPVLRVQPLIGRMFSAADDSPGSPPTVILSYAYWQRRLGGDSSAIGRKVIVDGSPRDVIGVMPRGFRFLRSTQTCLFLSNSTAMMCS